MKHLNAHLLTLFSLLLLLRWAPDSEARAFRLAKLPGGGPNFGCAACHINPGGGGERNAFGLDYEAIGLAAGDVYTDELGQKDSDGDGFSNDEEFNSNPPTEPWNLDSRPPNVAVEPLGKMFAVWARLKLEPIGSGSHFQSTSKNTVPALATSFKRTPQPIHREDSAEIEENSSVAKDRIVSANKPFTKSLKKNFKAGAKLRAASK